MIKLEWYIAMGTKSGDFAQQGLPTLYGSAKDWGTFLGRNAPILGGVQMTAGAYGIYNSTKN